MDKDIFLAEIRALGKIDLDSIPCYSNYDPATGRYIDMWYSIYCPGRDDIIYDSSVQLDGEDIEIFLSIDAALRNVCGNPPKSANCVIFMSRVHTDVKWNEIPDAVAYEALSKLPMKYQFVLAPNTWNYLSFPVLPKDTNVDSVFWKGVTVYKWDIETQSYKVPLDVKCGKGYAVYGKEEETIVQIDTGITTCPVVTKDSILALSASLDEGELALIGVEREFVDITSLPLEGHVKDAKTKEYVNILKPTRAYWLEKIPTSIPTSTPAPTTKTVTFDARDENNEEVKGVKLYINGELKGKI